MTKTTACDKCHSIRLRLEHWPKAVRYRGKFSRILNFGNCDLFRSLEIGIWILFVIRYLVLGIFTLRAQLNLNIQFVLIY